MPHRGTPHARTLGRCAASEVRPESRRCSCCRSCCSRRSRAPRLRPGWRATCWSAMRRARALARSRAVTLPSPPRAPSSRRRSARARARHHRAWRRHGRGPRPVARPRADRRSRRPRAPARDAGCGGASRASAGRRSSSWSRAFPCSRSSCSRSCRACSSSGRAAAPSERSSGGGSPPALGRDPVGAARSGLAPGRSSTARGSGARVSLRPVRVLAGLPLPAAQARGTVELDAQSGRTMPTASRSTSAA